MAGGWRSSTTEGSKKNKHAKEQAFIFQQAPDKTRPARTTESQESGMTTKTEHWFVAVLLWKSDNFGTHIGVNGDYTGVAALNHVAHS